MDLGDSDTVITLLSGIAILVGVIGVVIPLLPGLALCWGGVLVWAVFAAQGWGRWVVLAIATALGAAGIITKYAWPGRNLKRSEVPNSSLLAGGLLAIVGFFLIPFFGLFIGFVLGVWLAEGARLGDLRAAWPSTREALKATGLAMLVELATGLLISATWLVGVFAT